MTTAVWETVATAIAEAPFSVIVLPPDNQRASECLSGLGITTNSWLGAVVGNSGGLVVAHGWLRVLGSGADALPGILTDADPTTGRLTVAHDVLGGQFVWSPNHDGQPTIHYFAPDDLSWQDLGQGYADWLSAMLTGALDRFYDTLRWPGWQQEVAALRTDHGIHTWPPPWSAEGKDLSTASRKVMPMAELISFHHDTARQLNGQES